MSTSNFITQKEFPLVVCTLDDNDEAEFLANWLEDNLVGPTNQNLIFYNISLQDGYYTSFQLYAYENTELYNWGKPQDLDNEDCWYVYGMNRSTAIRKFNAEQKRIVKFFKYIARIYVDMEEIRCAGMFSNGEAVYERA